MPTRRLYLSTEDFDFGHGPRVTQPMIVADSGPLHYRILLQHIELLRRFYGQVLVPEPVA